MVVAPNAAPEPPPRDVVIVFALDLEQADEARDVLISLCGRYGQNPLVIDAAAEPLFREALEDPRNRAHFPLLCVRGKLVGGTEIIRALHAAGKLEELLAPTTTVEPPTIALSVAAANELKAAMTEPGAVLRIVVTEQFEHDLIIDEAKPDDVHLNLGQIPCVLDPESARRANGLAIDWVVQSDSKGFRIDNPNQPDPVHYVDSAWVCARLDCEPGLLVVDARTKSEYARGHLPRARLLDATVIDDLERGDFSRPLFFYCQNGVRSRIAAERYREQGYRAVYCLTYGLTSLPGITLESP